MKTKPGVIISLPSGRGTPTTNAKGFDRHSLGRDTVPGPMVGAPLMNSRTVDDGTVKRAVYVTGNPHNQFSMPEVRGATMGVDDGRPPTADSPVPGHGQRPNRDITSKAGEVHANDPSAGVGARPSGTLVR